MMNATAQNTANASINPALLNSLPVVLRKGPDGKFCAFFVNSLNVSRKSVEMWAEGSGKRTHVTSLEFYNSCTRLNDEEKARAAEQFAQEYDVKYGLKLRDRLSKSFADHKTAVAKNVNDTFRRAADTQPAVEVQPVEAPKKEWNKDEYMVKLQAALTISMTAAINAAFAAVNSEDM